MPQICAGTPWLDCWDSVSFCLNLSNVASCVTLCSKANSGLRAASADCKMLQNNERSYQKLVQAHLTCALHAPSLYDII